MKTDVLIQVQQLFKHLRGYVYSCFHRLSSEL